MFSRIATGAAAATLLAGASAHAGYISYLDLPRHESFVSMEMDGVQVDVQAGAGTFKTRRKGYKAGTGIKHGAIKNLIDDSEAITITFSHPVYVDLLGLNRLFAKGQRKDRPNEMAMIHTDASDFELEAMSRSEAMWTGPDAMARMTVEARPFGGHHTVSAPHDPTGIFGVAITSIELCSAIPGDRYKFSDFSFVNLSFTPAPDDEPITPIDPPLDPIADDPPSSSNRTDVPAPGALPVLALLGAATSRRRRTP